VLKQNIFLLQGSTTIYTFYRSYS